VTPILAAEDQGDEMTFGDRRLHVDTRHRPDVSNAQIAVIPGPLGERGMFDPKPTFKIGPVNGRKARESGLRPKVSCA
jgi:hypothetical protein